MPFNPVDKNPGDPIRSTDWNEMAAEIVRLEGDKVNRLTAEAMTGPLTIEGALGVGAAAQNEKLEIHAGFLKVSNVAVGGGFTLGSPRGNGNYVNLGSNHHATVLLSSNLYLDAENDDLMVSVTHPTMAGAAIKIPGNSQPRQNHIEFWTTPTGSVTAGNAYGASEPLMVITPNGSVGIGKPNPDARLDIVGALKISTGNDADNDISITREVLGINDSSNTLKVTLSELQLLGQPNPTYAFSVGHPSQIMLPFPSPIPRNIFRSVFNVNSDGSGFLSGSLSVQDLTIRSGNKPGYVADYFINRTGESVDQGDVVILGKGQVSNYWATGNDIPIPEADLTDIAYDTRVCGIVAKAVTANMLPYVQGVWAEQIDLSGIVLEEKEIAAGKEEAEDQLQIPEHPLKKYVDITSEELDQTIVQDNLVGMMVIMGAYSYCKVDADIAPIEPGDLLTTSPTKGHAQKVEDPTKAIGAIVGKALGEMKSGKGKIPVLVMLQ